MVGNIPRLIEALRTRAGDDKHISCTEAFQLAQDLGLPLVEVGKACNDLGIKIVACQLGCF